MGEKTFDSAKTFHNISIRGRVAYAISCLENALKYYNCSLDGWQPVLEKYWSYTNITFLDDWHEQIAECMPLAILEELSYEQKGLQYLDRNEYENLRHLYSLANSVVLDIANSIFYLGTVDLYGKLTNHSPNTLEELEQIISYMKNNNITLPEINQFSKFSYDKREGWGDLFEKDALK